MSLDPVDQRAELLRRCDKWQARAEELLGEVAVLRAEKAQLQREQEAKEADLWMIRVYLTTDLKDGVDETVFYDSLFCTFDAANARGAVPFKSHHDAWLGLSSVQRIITPIASSLILSLERYVR